MSAELSDGVESSQSLLTILTTYLRLTALFLLCYDSIGADFKILTTRTKRYQPLQCFQ